MTTLSTTCLSDFGEEIDHTLCITYETWLWIRTRSIAPSNRYPIKIWKNNRKKILLIQKVLHIQNFENATNVRLKMLKNCLIHPKRPLPDRSVWTLFLKMTISAFRENIAGSQLDLSNCTLVFPNFNPLYRLRFFHNTNP